GGGPQPRRGRARPPAGRRDGQAPPPAPRPPPLRGPRRAALRRAGRRPPRRLRPPALSARPRQVPAPPGPAGSVVEELAQEPGRLRTDVGERRRGVSPVREYQGVVP